MPGRIDGYEPFLAAAPVLPLWKRAMISRLKRKPKKVEKTK